MRRILPISVTIMTICSIVSAEVKKDTSKKAEPRVEVLQKAKKFGFPRAHKSPRPTPNQTHVPLQTSFSIQLVLKNGAPGDVVVPNSVAVTLTPDVDQLRRRFSQRQETLDHGPRHDLLRVVSNYFE